MAAGGVGDPSSGASLASCSPYGRNTTKADIYISANDFGIYPSAQGKYPKKITKPIVLETVVWYLSFWRYEYKVGPAPEVFVFGGMYQFLLYFYETFLANFLVTH